MSVSQVHDRWFIVPAVTETLENRGSRTRPKYADDDRIRGFSGNTVVPGVVDDHYPALTQLNPAVAEWYIVRMYGRDNPGWQALNEIHNKQDTRTLADHATDVAPVLNQRFPDLDRPATDWSDKFRVTL